MNRLFVGNTVETIRDVIADDTVDMVFADPPFASSFNAWRDSPQSRADLVEPLSDEVARCLMTFNGILGASPLMSYLEFVGGLLSQFQRVLKPSGSLYLHTDVDYSSYLRLLCDSVFGHDHLRNELIWRYRRLSPKDPHRWSRTSSRILYYAVSDETPFIQLHKPLSEDQEKQYRYVEAGTERRYRLDSLLAPSSSAARSNEFEFMGFHRRWRYSYEKLSKLLDEGRIERKGDTSPPRLKRYLDETTGRVIGDIWDDIPLLPRSARDDVNFSSTTPPELAARLIESSTKTGDTVLDPFCGTGAFVVEAHTLRRNWVGISETPITLPLVTYRLATHASSSTQQELERSPDPSSVPEAQALSSSSPELFECWVLHVLRARPILRKWDKGVDGIIEVFDNPSSAKPTRFLVQVKIGTASAHFVDRLSDNCADTNSAAVILVVTDELSANVRQKISQAGVYESPLGTVHPRIQCVTLEQLLSDGSLDLPDAPRFAERISPKRKDGGSESKPSLW